MTLHRRRRRHHFALASALLAGAALVVPRMEARQSQAKVYPLESAAGLRVSNLKITPATLDGKKGVQLASTGVEEVALIEGVEFDNGVIEAEVAGTPGPGAGEGARGFVGIAFRVQKDMQTYDAFYLRPTNGRADDQERRNHVTQYISHPEWTWARLRKETPRGTNRTWTWSRTPGPESRSTSAALAPVSTSTTSRSRSSS